MCLYNIFNRDNKRKQDVQLRKPSESIPNTNGYISGLYYSNWSPYSPRSHFPHDIDTRMISHIYYAFFLLDSKTGELKSSDEWSDFQMNCNAHNNHKTKSKLNGCIGELFELKANSDKKSKSHVNRSFKMIMSVGGWSNRESFTPVVRDTKKLSRFIDSCVETMFEYGFDGIDLDWEFPKDDGFEPSKYLEMVKLIRQRLNQLEINIWGHSKKRFQLSVATPGFDEKLKILPIDRMNKYVDYWNMMTYDYYGEWSSRTGYHSNLYNGKNLSGIQLQYKHEFNGNNNGDNNSNGDSAIKYMLDHYKIESQKLVLGMAMYGRSFTNVDVTNNEMLCIDKKFNGVNDSTITGDEPGLWLYNQLPLHNTKEIYDPHYVAAFCFDPRTRTMVGYDNVDSTKVKAQYIKSHRLAGGFWWESCGNTWKHKERSLVNTYAKNIGMIQKQHDFIYMDTRLISYYKQRQGSHGFLTKYFESLNDDC